MSAAWLRAGAAPEPSSRSSIIGAWNWLITLNEGGSSKSARTSAPVWKAYLSVRHLFVLGHIQAHIETLRCEITDIDAYLFAAMQP